MEFKWEERISISEDEFTTILEDYLPGEIKYKEKFHIKDYDAFFQAVKLWYENERDDEYSYCPSFIKKQIAVELEKRYNKNNAAQPFIFINSMLILQPDIYFTQS